MIILGIDPGSRSTGYGVIKVEGQRHIFLAHGNIRTQSDELGDRLFEIFDKLNQVIREFNPMQAAVEQVFMARNAQSALKLGQARGAAMLAAAQAGLAITEYSAKQIKQAIVGYGAADKHQMQHMVKVLLNLGKIPQSDAADALAAAICHAHWSHVRQKIPT